MKSIKFTVVALTIIMSTPFAFAQETTTTPPAPTLRTERQTQINLLKQKEDALREKASSTREMLREKASTTKANILEKAQTMREKVQEKKTEIKNNFDAKKIAILKRTAENTIKVLQAAIARLEQIAKRLDSRIAKMETNKIDVSKAKADLVIARQKITDAKTALTTAITAIGGIEEAAKNASTTPNVMGESTAKIKALAKTVKDALQAAHTQLVLVTSELKGKEGPGNKHATTTQETVQ